MAFLVKRGDVWYIKYKEGDKWRWSSTGSCFKSVAMEKLKDVQEREDRSYNLVFSSKKNATTLGEFADIHLSLAKLEVSPQWLKEKKITFKAHLRPFFGDDTPLEEITSARIKQYQAKRLDDGANPKTVNKEVSCLTKMLRHAILDSIIPSNCVPVVKRLKEAQGRLRFLSDDEIPKLKDAAKLHSPEMQSYIMLCLYAGLRSSEALHLRTMDISLARRSIVITGYDDVDDRSGKPIKWSPKTNQRRGVPMMDELYQFLFDRVDQVGDSKFIVRGNSGLSFDFFEREFRSVVKAAGLETSGENKVTCHSLRHSFASHLIMRGVSIFDLSKLLGHSNVQTTMIYAHLSENHLERVVKQISF